MNYGFGRGRFCALKDNGDPNFQNFWWKETCDFQEYLAKKFPHDSIYVSDQIQNYKEFCIEPEEKPSLEDLCESSLEYLEEEHPDASVVIANPLGYRNGVGRITLTLQGVWIDQDILWWLLDSTRNPDMSLSELGELGELGGKTKPSDIRQALAWTKDITGLYEASDEFWRGIYSNRDLPPIGRTDAEETNGYALGGEIVSRLRQRYFVLDENKVSDVWVSGSLGTHRIIKIECSQRICGRDFVENVFRIVSGTDGSWAVRIAAFDDLVADNSYLGGIVVNRNGQFLFEAGV